MKEKTIKDFKVITNSNSTNFEKEVKDFLSNNADLVITEFNSGATNKGSWCHICYEKNILIAENIKDEYVLRGEVFHCGNCPLWDNGCLIQVRSNARFCNDACLHFYQRLAEGEFRPVDYPPLEQWKKDRDKWKERE